MGKITKRHQGQPCEIQFSRNKVVSIQIENSTVFVCEIGLFDAVLRKICSKDIKLYESILEILIDSTDLETAILKLNNLYLEGERRTIHEKDIRPDESLSDVEIGIALERKRLEKWDFFQDLADSFYGHRPITNFNIDEVRDAIFEALSAYVDRNHPDHKKVNSYLLTLHTGDPLHHPEDGLFILRDMITKSMARLEKKEDQELLKRLFRRTVKRYRISLRNFFYEPLPYLNDIDGAETWLEEAERHASEHDLQAALISCVKAINAAPNYLAGYYQAVHYCVLKKDFKEAVKLLESVKDMPMAEKILAHRKDYYLIYKSLCLKMPSSSEAKIYLENLNTLAEKYHMDLAEKKTDA